jgi:hypothetical protein
LESPFKPVKKSNKKNAMKKTSMLLALLASQLQNNSQTVVADFETFTLQPNSYYKDTNNVPFQTSHASFDYEWTKGQYPFWSGGFSYTNAYDSSNGTFTNLYGVKPYKGSSGSAMYAVGQQASVIRIKVPQTTVQGFYCTNTTYAFKSIRNGDSFARKFGDTTGTGSGTTIAQGSYPDYFKVTVRGYRNGVLLPDSVPFFLADYRFSNNSQDYVVDDWRFVNTSSLGIVDSIKFFMYSSVFDEYGMLTPGFFGIDNFTTSTPNPVALQMNDGFRNFSVYPNPFIGALNVRTDADGLLNICDMTGKVICSRNIGKGQSTVTFDEMAPGLYFLSLSSGDQVQVMKILKQ